MNESYAWDLQKRRKKGMKPVKRALLFLLIACLLAVSSPNLAIPAPTRTVAVDHGAYNPAISPDGNRIAVGIFGKIWILPVSGGEANQVTDGLGWDSHPAWSPDGPFLLYVHAMPNGADLVELNLATSYSRVLYHAESAIGQISYHPKGGEVFFIQEKSQLDSHLWKMPLGDGEPTQITFTDNWHEWSFALSPDGKEVVLDSGRFGGSNLYRIQLPKLETKRLTNTPLHQFGVDWSQSGKFWIYIESENGVDTIVVQPVAGGSRRPIFSSPYDQKELVLAPDNKTALLCAGRKLFRLDLSSGKTIPVNFNARFVRPALSKADLLITNARLFDGTGKEVVSNATIMIQDGRIASIQPGQASAEKASGVPMLDAAGKFVMPGLMDNHYHYWTAFQGGGLLSRGITSVRDLGTAISTTMNFKEGIALGLLTGPNIYAMGPLIDGLGGYHPLVDVELSKPEAAAPLVRALKAQGVDALKVYFQLSPDVLRAVVQEARAEGLPVSGHIGVRTSWRTAMEAGINGLSHIRVWRDFLPLERQPQGENESLDATKNLVARMQADWTAIDPEGPEVGELLQMMAEKKVGFDPTLSIQNIGEGSRRQFSMDEFSITQETYKKMGQFVARAQKMGVMLLAGTDNGSLFTEMEEYEKAGVPNVEILKSATLNGAQWLGKEKEFGTIEPGKRADLILIDGDPIKSMKDIRNVSVVIKEGRIVFQK
jgi:imidazolonepropionase-like amidohydrolase